MRRAFRIRLGLLVALVAIALPAICAAPEGILHPGPGTTVDGTPALDGMHVFGGQLLRTPHGQFGDLFTGGSSLRLLGDTKLRFDGDSAELVEGGVALNTTSRFSVRTGCTEVTPLTATAARYTVQLQQKTVYVTAERNDVTVRARKTVRVPAGKAVAVFCAAPKQDIVFVGKALPAKIIMGAAVAGMPTPLALKQDMSSSSPSQ